MARYSEFDTQPIYDVAAKLFARCLNSDGSLIDDGEALWTPSNLDKLHSVFVAAPDIGDRSFMEKFEDQVKPAGPEICQLAAEVLAVYFLFPSSVGAARKTELVGLVLSWAGKALLSEGPLEKVLSQGIGSGGQGYNTRRPFEIAFIIELAIAWKRLADEERTAAAADPWKFMAFTDSVEGADTRQVRHMLLHILFPDTFERIASRDHKRRVVLSFASLLDSTDSEDIDRRLFAIRAKLEDLFGRKDFDFYWPPLVEVTRSPQR